MLRASDALTTPAQYYRQIAYKSQIINRRRDGIAELDNSLSKQNESWLIRARPPTGTIHPGVTSRPSRVFEKTLALIRPARTKAQASLKQERDRPNRVNAPQSSFQAGALRTNQYRPEIDGLRAIAVLPVLFFHAAIPGFAGGFVGVDVFFVISGYLITSVIAKDVELGRFSFARFYERRIRRIFPALFAVVMFTVLAGGVLLAPKDFAAFGKSLIAMTFFLSNTFFKGQGGVGGYFSGTPNPQVLLHTWSLSVEEQFYLFFPTALILLARFAKKGAVKYLSVAVVTSFVINIWATRFSPGTAFYDLVPRAWELLLGSLLALKAVPPLAGRALREIAGIMGIGLIALSISVLSKDTAFPGYSALFPCVGAFLIIYAGENGPSLVTTILSSRPLVFIGVISYSLYLWHWPIVVFAKYLIVGEWGASESTIVILLSLAIAIISYEFIESPFRRGNSHSTRWRVFTIGLGSSAVSAALGLTILLGQGVPGRFDDSTTQRISQNMDRKSDYQEVCSNWKRGIRSLDDIVFCNIGEKSSKKIMFWGDSHVQQLYPLVWRISHGGGFQGHGIVFAIAQGCTPSEHFNRPDPDFHCDSFTHFAMMRAEEEDVDMVFIGFSESPARILCPSVDGVCTGKMPQEEIRQRVLQELSEHIQKLKMLGKRVIVSLPFPLYDKSIPDLQISNAILQRFGLAEVATDIALPSTRYQMVSLAESVGAEIFDPRKTLCPNHACITEVNGVSIYKDDSHIAGTQIAILRDNLEKVLH
jgi:peptidoglycan/LPS O-acetylase OafA/YrhL